MWLAAEHESRDALAVEISQLLYRLRQAEVPVVVAPRENRQRCQPLGSRVLRRSMASVAISIRRKEWS